jgi:serine/threonine protein kinase
MVGWGTQLGDFGLSRVLGDQASHISTHTYGTISFMPPELVRDAKLSKAADVYSFGIMMWELFCSENAFDGIPHARVRPSQLPWQCHVSSPPFSPWHQPPFLSSSLGQAHDCRTSMCNICCGRRERFAALEGTICRGELIFGENALLTSAYTPSQLHVPSNFFVCFETLSNKSFAQFDLPNRPIK